MRICCSPAERPLLAASELAAGDTPVQQASSHSQLAGSPVPEELSGSPMVISPALPSAREHAACSGSSPQLAPEPTAHAICAQAQAGAAPTAMCSDESGADFRESLMVISPALLPA